MPSIGEKIGVCSWSLRPSNAANLADQLARLDISRVQLALLPLVNTPDAWRDLAPRLAAANVQIVSGMFGSLGEDYSTLQSIRRTGGVVPDEHWHANWAIAQRVAAQAQQLNLPMVSFHAGFIPDAADPGFAKLVDRLARLADLFNDAGCELLLETGQETAEQLNAFLNAVGRGNLGVNFDPANMILYDKGDPIASLRKLLPRVRQVHLKDALRTTERGQWGREVPVGQGQVDWRSFLQTLAEGDFLGHMMIEREAGADQFGDIFAAKQHITSLWEDLNRD
jgi:sugar phosphate isomerase/epimerase